jgi:hypothetical protein
MRGRLAQGVVAIFIVGLAMGSRPAFATPHDAGPLDLEWIAPPGCPTRDAVLDDVTRILGPKRIEALARVAARAVLFRGEDARWHVVITVPGGAGGERTLEASSCEEVANAAVLVLALRVDPTSFAPEMPLPSPPAAIASAFPPSEAPAPAPSDVPPQPPKPPPSAPREQPAPLAGTEAPPDPSAAPNSPSHYGILVGTAVVGGVGALPSADLGIEVTATLKRGRLRLEPLLGTSLVQHADVARSASEGAALRLARGGLRGCYAAIDLRLTLSGCVTGEVDWFWADGYGATTPENANAREAAFGAGALATWRLARRLVLRAQVEGLVGVSPPTFVIDDTAGNVASQVYRPAALIARATLGAEVPFF